jgi:polysaccharide biosynthesis/export protein
MNFAVLFRKLSALSVICLCANAALGQATTPSATGSSPTPASSEVTPISSSAAKTPPGSIDTSSSEHDLTIGAGDLLKIGVLGATDYDQEVRVSASGNVALALVGEVHVAGETIEQAEQTIRKRLIDKGFFSDPQVSVFEKEFATQGVSVLGEVQKPGVYPITGPRRLFDVVSMAGGTTPKAGQVVTIASRNKATPFRTVNFSSDPQKNLEANVDISPGDTVVVSKAGIVYVVGDVKHAMGVLMDNSGHITILQALAMAEGANSDANLHQAKIVRKTQNGGQSEIPVDLKKIMQAKVPDMTLQAEDVVFVPTSKGKYAGERTLQSIVSIATGVATYRAVY